MKTNKNIPDLAAQLMAEMGRINMNIVVNAIGEDQDYFASLVKLVITGQHPVNMRAAWAMTICLENHPEWINPHLPALMKILPLPAHPGIRRCILRSLLDTEPAARWDGYLMQHCFDWLLSPSETIATKAYSMQILYRISKRHPDIRHELAEAIETLIPDGSAGLKSCGQKILKQLNRDRKTQS
ncbi:MAG: hypothetical protein U0T82_03550 [Bacteroidales bacterium]